MGHSLGALSFRPTGDWKPNTSYRRMDSANIGRSLCYAKEDHESGETPDMSKWGYITDGRGVQEAAERAEIAADLAETHGAEAEKQAAAAKAAAIDANREAEAARDTTGIFTENFKSMTSDLYAYAIVDLNGNVLFGIKHDGSTYIPKGMPEETKRALDNLGGIQIVESPQYPFSIVDNDGNMLFALDNRGRTVINGVAGICEVEQFDSKGYMYAVVDTAGNLLFGVKTDGTFTASRFEMPDALGMIKELNDNEFIHIITDSYGRILFGIRNDGTTYIPKGMPEEVKAAIRLLDKRVGQAVERTANMEERMKDYTENNNISINKVMYNGNQGKPYIGNVAIQRPGMTHYCVIMMYGQSLSNGSENPAGFYDTPEEGCYMLGSNVWDVNGTKLNPLSCGGNRRADGVATGTRQDTIVSTVNAFARLFRANCPWGKDVKFIACSAGVGGRTVAQLSNAKRYPDCNEHNLDTRFRVALQNMKSIADKEGATISCSAVFWMQGESDYGTGYIGYKEADVPRTAGTSQACGGSKDAYKKRLTELKEDIQALCKEVFGEDQQCNPVFFPYSVCGGYINNSYMTINAATAEMAEEQDDVIQVGPTYVVPDYNGGHLAMNGYRWYGEYCAKTMFLTFVHGLDFRPLEPYNFEVKDNKIYMYFNPMVPPLRFDHYTQAPLYKNEGFRVKMGTVAELDAEKSGTSKDINITNIAIIENCVVLTCDRTLAGCIEITYAGQTRSGAGNLRDSDTFQSLYSYRSDIGDHGSRTTYTQDGVSKYYWNGSTPATDAELQTLQYWDPTYASQTGYSNGDRVLFNVIEQEKPIVLTSTRDNNKTNPFNPVNYRPVDVKGTAITDRKYPLHNWCNNFYKRIILAGLPEGVTPQPASTVSAISSAQIESIIKS